MQGALLEPRVVDGRVTAIYRGPSSYDPLGDPIGPDDLNTHFRNQAIFIDDIDDAFFLSPLTNGTAILLGSFHPKTGVLRIWNPSTGLEVSAGVDLSSYRGRLSFLVGN